MPKSRGNSNFYPPGVCDIRHIRKDIYAFLRFKMVNLIFLALEEAKDINMYLRPARHHFEDYEQSEFDESGPLMAPMMHTIALIWVHSQYYNTPARIIVLLQEMCNMIINHVNRFWIICPLLITSQQLTDQ